MSSGLGSSAGAAGSGSNGDGGNQWQTAGHRAGSIVAPRSTTRGKPTPTFNQFGPLEGGKMPDINDEESFPGLEAPKARVVPKPVRKVGGHDRRRKAKDTPQPGETVHSGDEKSDRGDEESNFGDDNDSDDYESDSDDGRAGEKLPVDWSTGAGVPFGEPIALESIPPALKGAEKETYMYPDRVMDMDLKPVHYRYDGRDRLVMKAKGANSMPVRCNLATTLLIKQFYTPEEHARSQEENADCRKAYAFGQSTHPAVIRTNFDTASQTPALLFDINVGTPEQEKWVRCWIFGNAIHTYFKSDEQETAEDMDFAMIHSSSAKGKNMTLPAEVKVADSASADRFQNGQAGVLRITGALWHLDQCRDYRRTNNIALAHTRPIFKGVPEEQLFQWSKEALAGTNPLLTPGQKAAGLLYTAETFEAYAFDGTTNREAWVNQLKSYFEPAMAATCAWGPYWQYALQMAHLGTSMDDLKFQLNLLAPPRHLGTLWTVARSIDGADLDEFLLLRKWTSLGVPDVMPTATAGAFISRLGQYRDSQKKWELVKKNIGDKDVDAWFNKMEGTDTGYRIDMKVPMSVVKDDDGKIMRGLELMPDEGDTFSVRLTLEDVDQMQSGEVKMSGRVMRFKTPAANKDVNLSGIVHLKHKTTAHLTLEPREDRSYVVRVDMWIDKNSNDRKIRALEELGRGQRRTTGPDFPALMYGTAKRTIQPDWIKNKIDSNGKRPDMEKALARHNLNTEQRAAVTKIMDGKPWSVLHGPPGTGKTKTIVAMAETFAAGGFTTMVAAPVNGQVDNVMHEFKAKSDQSSSKNKFTRARNVYFKNTTLLEYYKRVTNPNSDLNMGNAYGDAVSQLDGEDAYAQIMATCIRDLIKKGVAVSKECTEYVALLAEYKNAPKDDKKAILQKVREKEELFIPDFAKRINVWFVTTNSAGAYQLATWAKPDLVIIDEAGLSSKADTAVVLASTLNSARAVCMAGDLNQCEPWLSSKDRNEAAVIMEKSVMSYLVAAAKDGDDDVAETFLQLQYRAHPDISKPLADLVYTVTDKDRVVTKLTDAPNTLVITPIQRTFKQFMATKFGERWSRSMLVAVSVDWPEAFSDRYQNGTSMKNDAEAGSIVSFVKELLEFEPTQISPAEPVQKITAKNIGVSAGYSGQCAVIRQQFINVGLENVAIAEEGEEDRIPTTAQVQGREFDIHIVSWTSKSRQNPHALGFITEKGQITVLRSRARNVLVEFGNFKQWATATVYNADDPTYARRSLFYGFVTHLYQEGVIMSGDGFRNGLNGDLLVGEDGKLIEEAAPISVDARQSHDMPYAPQGGTRGARGGRAGAAAGANRGGGRAGAAAGANRGGGRAGAAAGANRGGGRGRGGGNSNPYGPTFSGVSKGGRGGR